MTFDQIRLNKKALNNLIDFRPFQYESLYNETPFVKKDLDTKYGVSRYFPNTWKLYIK